MKHKGTDYKVSAVQYYKKHKKSLSQTCKILNCRKESLPKNIYEKSKNIQSLNELEMSVENSIKHINQNNYYNYFDFAYGDKTQFSYTKKPSTRKRKLKMYKS